MPSYKVCLPHQRNVEAAMTIYSMHETWQQVDRLISSYFQSHPDNSNEEHVIIKVVLINSLYYTQILKLLEVATHIVQLDEIDQQLRNGQIQAAERIANFPSRHLLSFASKYCHFHNKAAFPLYDGYACLSLAYCRGQSRYVSWRKYEDFCHAMSTLRKLACLTNRPWDEIDKYMYLFGIKMELDKGKTDRKPKGILKLYSEHRSLFEALEPEGPFQVEL